MRGKKFSAFLILASLTLGWFRGQTWDLESPPPPAPPQLQVENKSETPPLISTRQRKMCMIMDCRLPMCLNLLMIFSLKVSISVLPLLYPPWLRWGFSKDDHPQDFTPNDFVGQRFLTPDLLTTRWMFGRTAWWIENLRRALQSRMFDHKRWTEFQWWRWSYSACVDFEKYPRSHNTFLVTCHLE